MLLAAAWFSDWLSSRGLYAVALISALTDVDAITPSSLRLFNLDKLPVAAAVNHRHVANRLFKSMLALFIGRWQMARHAVAGMGKVGLGLVLSWAIMRGFSAL